MLLNLSIVFLYCSVQKLLHPYFLKYVSFLENVISNRDDLLIFLNMVRLKEGKLRWVLKQKGKKNKELANLCGIKVRRLQQLRAKYKKTGEIPQLNPSRRPRTKLSDVEQDLIDKALKASGLNGTVSIRLYIKKYFNKLLPYGKIHTYLLKKGITKPDPKKQKQRKYCRYERKHSFSLLHMDWHESKVIPGKQLCVVEDDASRFILAHGEFDHATTENSIILVKKAKKVAFEKYSAKIREINTDRGSQFYANRFTNQGKKGLSEFEKYLIDNDIEHIPSRRNHPQTNGKNERWFRTYEENRGKFKTLSEFIDWYNHRIHLGLSRTEGITPAERIIQKMQQESILGLFFRRIE